MAKSRSANTTAAKKTGGTSKSKRTKARRAKRRRLIKPDDLLKLHFVGDPQIAPGGSSIVFVKKHASQKNEYVTNLWRVDTATGSQPRQFTSGGRDGQPRWSPDGAQIAFVSRRDKARPQIHTISADGGEATPLTNLPEGTIGDYLWSPDGRNLALSFRAQDPEWTETARGERKKKGLTDPPRVLDDWWYRLDGDGYFNGQRFHLYIVDARSGKHRDIYGKDATGSFTFDFSPDGRKLIVATNRDKKALVRSDKAELLIVTVANGHTRALLNLPPGPKTAPRWSPDGNHIAYAGRVGVDSAYSTENLELFICDATKGGAKSLTGKEDYCLLATTLSDASEATFTPRFQWSANSKRLYMQLGWHGEAHIASVRRSGGAITFHTRGAQVHNLGNFSANGRAVALTVARPTRPDEVHLGELQKDGSLNTRALTNLNGPTLGRLDLATIRSHWVTTPDGTKCQFWCMNPPGFSAKKKYPAVLEIHGGPHAQYGVGFFHEFQTLAAAGYIVYFSNPRGSKGYGRDHCAAIRGSWGQADWVDIQAVTDLILKETSVDARRVGVMGGSYGGYMTNWAIGHTNVFAGAITDRCVSNLVSKYGNSDYYTQPDQYWEGNAWDRPEARWNASPIKYFNKVKTPTLIIHSEGDLRCNIEQSEQVFTALKMRNVPARFVRYPRATSHGMSRSGPPDMRLHRLAQILNWWAKYLGK